MEKSLWLATAYIQKAEQLDQFVALATFATTAEEFEQRARVHFAQKPTFAFNLHLFPLTYSFNVMDEPIYYIRHQHSEKMKYA